MPKGDRDELKDRSFAANASRARAVSQIASPSLSPIVRQCSVKSRSPPSATWQASCVILAAGQPPSMWAGTRPIRAIRGRELVAPKRSVAHAPRPRRWPRSGGHTKVGCTRGDSGAARCLRPSEVTTSGASRTSQRPAAPRGCCTEAYALLMLKLLLHGLRPSGAPPLPSVSPSR